MMKKIAALAATSTAILAMSAGPSQSLGTELASAGGYCTTSDGSHMPALSISLHAAPGAYYDVALYFQDERKRKWDWKLFHDGWQPYGGTFDLEGSDGIKTIVRNVPNHSGEDKVRYRLVNASGTVVCNTSLTYPVPPSGPQ